MLVPYFFLGREGGNFSIEKIIETAIFLQTEDRSGFGIFHPVFCGYNYNNRKN
jgi:hypothetical protein